MQLQNRLTLVAAALLCVNAAACTSPVDSQHIEASDRSADEAAIRALIKESAAASSALDALAVAATYAPDGDAWIAGLGTAPTRNQDSITEMERSFTSMQGFQRWDVKIESIRFISRDAAIVEVTGTTVMDSGSFDEKTTIVVARTDGEWKIQAWRVMDFSDDLLTQLQG